jgi:hypothetical protein
MSIQLGQTTSAPFMSQVPLLFAPSMSLLPIPASNNWDLAQTGVEVLTEVAVEKAMERLLAGVALEEVIVARACLQSLENF